MGPDDEVQDAERRFGGRVLVRMPASLHRELVMAAEADNVSLNQFVCALLAGGMRWRQGDGDGSDDASASESGKNRVSEEEYQRIWRKTFG